MFIDTKLLQPSNAPYPIDVTKEGIWIETNFVQFLNAYLGKASNPFIYLKSSFTGCLE